MDQLANPAWYALTGPQASVAEQHGSAARFEPGLSVFGALPDESTPAAWSALHELIGPGGLVILMQEGLVTGDGWTELFSGLGVQMVLTAPAAALQRRIGTESAPKGFGVVRLGDGDVAEMMDLVARTEPGPFTDRTHELGTYLGVRDGSDGALVAMAGQRLHPPGHVEISAVCTDEAFRGQGLARLLVDLLIDEITAAGDLPILHAASTNAGAIGLYESMGFETTREVRFAALQAPGRATGTGEDQTG
jgi:ribosomal protein S18 acetylase RimI-like enzyme